MPIHLAVQTVILLFVIFWVSPRRPCNVDIRRFGTLCRFHPRRQIPYPPAYEDGTDREFRNVGYQRYMDAGDLPKR